MATAKSERFTEGPLFGKIALYALPLIATGVLQLLYNAADQIVVGRFSGDPNALGAVGSCASLNNLIVNFLIGLSIGSSVVIAQFFGAKKDSDVSKAVHTSVTLGFIGGVIMALVGFFAFRPLLTLMGTQDIYMEKAVLYVRIISLGIPASAVFNFGATVLRATGDSKTPLMILATTGLANVLFNLVFVMGFGMSVEGVALATIIAQYLSATWVITKLRLSRECFCLRFSKLRIHKSALLKILAIGVPSGIQSSLFSLSNVFIQSAANTLSPIVIEANTIGGTIEGITYISMNSFQQACITFVGQNYGANKMDRVKKTLFYSLIQVFTVGVLTGYTEILLNHPLASFFIAADNPNKEAIIAAVLVRGKYILSTYFLCGIMEVLSGYLRGLGSSVSAMMCSLIGACLLRIVWTQFIFPLEPFNSPIGLYICWPITWIITCIALGVFCIICTRKIIKTKYGRLSNEPC